MENPRAEIKSTIEQYFKALDTQNLELISQLIPEDDSMVHIETDSDEIWKGSEELNRSTEEQFHRVEYCKANIRDLTILNPKMWLGIFIFLTPGLRPADQKRMEGSSLYRRARKDKRPLVFDAGTRIDS